MIKMVGDNVIQRLAVPDCIALLNISLMILSLSQSESPDARWYLDLRICLRKERSS
jgi:hypothetical protein